MYINIYVLCVSYHSSSNLRGCSLFESYKQHNFFEVSLKVTQITQLLLHVLQKFKTQIKASSQPDSILKSSSKQLIYQDFLSNITLQGLNFSENFQANTIKKKKKRNEAQEAAYNNKCNQEICTKNISEIVFLKTRKREIHT